MAKRKMTGSDAKRAHESAAIEATALGTTAATMLLGVLAGAADAGNRAVNTAENGNHRNVDHSDLSVSPDGSHENGLGRSTVGVDISPAADTHIEGVSAATDTTNIHVQNETTLPQEQKSAPPQEQISAPPMSHSADGGTHFDLSDTTPYGHASEAVSSALPAHDLSITAATLLEPSLESFSKALTAATESVQHVASTLPDIGASISTFAVDMSHMAMNGANAAAGTLINGVFATETAALGDTPLLDHSGLVLTGENVTPITVGLVGQPQSDGHDAHDGAFSMLGLHHF